MTSSPADLSALRSSTAALLRGVADEQWSDEDVRAPSLLPGWSRGHVLAHLSRNADGIARTMAGALRGERVERYPDGRAGRDADIEAGAGRPMAAQLLDLQESADRLDRVLAAIAEADGWSLPCDDRTAGEYILGRWREVEIHRVDLGGAYSARDWPPAFIQYLLPTVLENVEGRLRGGGALQLEVDRDISLTQEFGGSVWICGEGEPTVVHGPDWGLLAWLLGRPAAGAVTGAPQLEPWL
jgi:maleylpyruvate isomerase